MKKKLSFKLIAVAGMLLFSPLKAEAWAFDVIEAIESVAQFILCGSVAVGFVWIWQLHWQKNDVYQRFRKSREYRNWKNNRIRIAISTDNAKSTATATAISTATAR